MVEVFDRSDVPAEAQKDERTEHYTLLLMPVPPESFVVMQLRVWWNQELQQVQRVSRVLATVDAESEATRIYGEQRADLLRRGFVNSDSARWKMPFTA